MIKQLKPAARPDLGAVFVFCIVVYMFYGVFLIFGAPPRFRVPPPFVKGFRVGLKMGLKHYYVEEISKSCQTYLAH
jgi:hypothetical protein